MPFSVRLAAGFTSPMEKITAAISLAKGMYNEAMGVAHGLYEVGAVISHVKLSDIHLVHSLSDYTSNLKNTTKLAFTSVGDSLLSIANKNYTMLTSNSPAIAGYAAGQLAGDAIIAYAAPKGMSLASNAIKTVGAKTLGMFARTARGAERFGQGIQNLSKLKPKQIKSVLENGGYNGKKISGNGYQSFTHSDGSQIVINWKTGRVVRTEAPRYDATGRRINKGQRLASDGSRIPRSIPHEQHPSEFFNTNNLSDSRWLLAPTIIISTNVNGSLEAPSNIQSKY